jgi:diguanylate cyclase (GGDEF)-like protein
MGESAGSGDGIRFPWRGELDSVTKLPPRKALDNDLPALLRTMGREGLGLSALMIDIDHFKKFNDRWGHEMGDIVLDHVAGLIRNSVKYRGEAYRYGGEEITVLLPNTTAPEALATAENIRELVYRNALVPQSRDGGDPLPLSVTVSIGVSCFPDVDGSMLMVAADQALYTAKKEGRNRAVLYERKENDRSGPVTLDVRFPASSSIGEGSYIILARWFRHRGELTEIEAREISDPGRGIREFAEGPVPPGGPVTAEVRGRVSGVERRGNSTFFSFEVEAEVLDLMYHHLELRGL